MSIPSSVSLSPTSLASLANLLSRLEDGNVKDLSFFHETDEATGDSLWMIYATFYDLESCKIVCRNNAFESSKLR